MTTENYKHQHAASIQTGIEGLDDVLQGGLVPNRMYLLEGDPGSGKTTLAMQFLLAGCRKGEPCLYVTLSESEEELRASAASHGWDLEGINILEIISSEDSLKADARYTMFHPSEVELGETTKAVLAEAERIKPVRLVFDSLSELRLLAENPLRFRRQILALKQYFSRQQCTFVFIDDRTGGRQDMDLHTLVHGVISMTRQTSDYGTARRRIQVSKLRGRAFREGHHDMVIQTGGIAVFPRLVAAEHHRKYARETIKSGLEGLDSLLGGGLTKGTSTLLLGTAGTGKSSIATQFVCSAAAKGEHASMFLFDEAVATFLERSAELGMQAYELVSAGRINVKQVDPAELSPGEFAYSVRRAVEKDGTRVVVIDSLNGYLNAMPSERFLMLHLHELAIYLGQQGVTTLFLMNQSGIIGNITQAPVDASYLADAVILLRYFEAGGEVRKAVSVIKKRTGDHERTIRELYFSGGIQIGEPVRDFQGVLTGQPELVRNDAMAMERSADQHAGHE
jgi:circadian clock protein KaiC